MKMRVFTFLLAALPLALTAHAGDISMDAGAYTSNPRADCASARSLHADAGDSAAGNSDAGHVSAGSNSSRIQVSDDAAAESGADSTTGSSATSSPLAVPVKSRSARWQSLVPGAIK